MPKKQKHNAPENKLQRMQITALPCGGYVIEDAGSRRCDFPTFIAGFSTSAELLAWLGENIATT